MNARLLDLYYRAKPFIPSSVRFKVRQMRALRLRQEHAATWPIDARTAAPPEGWPGWPMGKRFAFVLTHDVEGVKGLRQCEALARLELNLGFRSCFNLVPEGEYDVPDALRAFLERNGFEVGVHDLHHDGSLYRSRDSFMTQAVSINRYLAGWKATGFRAGFMFHNLEWLRALDVRYDASTFDTDPFEPQPDGAGTIFPFWVPRGDGSGFVELPYTLPQDSTLFLVLRCTTNDIWKEKLDWIAANGGMALVNVHPDYLAFGRRSGPREFASELYSDLLSYVITRYGNHVWRALPHQVASHVEQCLKAAPVKANVV